MFLSQEKVPLKVAQPESEKANADAGADEENPYLRAGPPPPAPPPSLRARVAKEASSRWYLWAALVFASLLVGGLVVFREALLEAGGIGGLAGSRRGAGLPTLAIKNNAAEACATECAAEAAEGGAGRLGSLSGVALEGEEEIAALAAAAAAVSSSAEAGGGGGGNPNANVDDAYAACYAKCVAQETKDVVQEHEQFVREEKEIAAEEEKAAAAAAKAKEEAGGSGGAAAAAAATHQASSSSTSDKTQEDIELEALLEEVLDSMP